MSIFGQSKLERKATLQDDLTVCDDCGYDGPECNRDVDLCGNCRQNTHAGGEDICEHCGASGFLVMACPKCGGRLSPDYERLQPLWDAKRAFARFEAACSRFM